MIDIVSGKESDAVKRASALYRDAARRNYFIQDLGDLFLFIQNLRP